MEQPAVKYVQERCQNLRWKGVFIDPESSVADAEHFWCCKSQHALGPDGKLVNKYDCNPARGCYKAL